MFDIRQHDIPNERYKRHIQHPILGGQVREIDVLGRWPHTPVNLNRKEKATVNRDVSVLLEWVCLWWLSFVAVFSNNKLNIFFFKSTAAYTSDTLL